MQMPPYQAHTHMRMVNGTYQVRGKADEVTVILIYESNHCGLQGRIVVCEVCLQLVNLYTPSAFVEKRLDLEGGKKERGECENWNYKLLWDRDIAHSNQSALRTSNASSSNASGRNENCRDVFSL